MNVLIAFAWLLSTVFAFASGAQERLKPGLIYLAFAFGLKAVVFAILWSR